MVELCKTCGGKLKMLPTYEGDPEGIRHDRKCSNCGQVWGVTKAMFHKINLPEDVFNQHYGEIENKQIEINVANKFFVAQKALFDHVGFKPDWVEYAIDDHLDKVWSENGETVKYADSTEKFHNGLDYFEDEIYTQRFYSKWVYRGKDVTMIFCNPHTDGVNWFKVFDNAKEIK
jgi:hypothetical protein